MKLTRVLFGLGICLCFSGAKSVKRAKHFVIQKEFYPFHMPRFEQKHTVYIDNVVLPPTIHDDIDSWIPIINELADGAPADPTSHFWSEFFENERFIAFKAAKTTFRELLLNAVHSRYRCAVEIHMQKKGKVLLAVETLKVYANKELQVNFLPRHPQIKRLDGRGAFTIDSSEVTKCYPLKTKQEVDQQIELVKQSRTFTRKTWFGGVLRLRLQNVTMTKDLFSALNIEMSQLPPTPVRAITMLNEGSHQELPLKFWKDWDAGKNVSMFIRPTVFEHLLEQPTRWEYSCKIEVLAPSWSSVQISVDHTQIHAQGMFLMNLLSPFPTVRLQVLGQKPATTSARVIGCRRKWRLPRLSSHNPINLPKAGTCESEDDTCHKTPLTPLKVLSPEELRQKLDDAEQELFQDEN